MAEPSELRQSLARFAATVPLGDPDRVMLGLLRAKHATELHTVAEWRALIAGEKGGKVSYSALRQPAAAPGRR